MSVRFRGRFLAVVLLFGFNADTLAGRLYSTGGGGDSIPSFFAVAVGIDADGSDGTKGGGQANEPQPLMWLERSRMIGLAVDVQADEVYWTAQEYSSETFESVTYIGRATTAGCETLHIGIPGAIAYEYLALDVESDKLYWTERGSLGNGRLRRSNRDGSGTETLVGGLESPERLRLDVAHGKVYWTEVDQDGRIARANLDGSNVETVVWGGGVHALAVDPVAGKLYWNAGEVPYLLHRADLDGSNPEELFELQAFSIDVDPYEGKIYWPTPADFFSPGVVRRANLDGSNVEIVSVSYLLGASEIVFNPADVLVGPYPCGPLVVPAIGLGAGLVLVAALLLGSAIFARRRISAHVAEGARPLPPNTGTMPT